MECFLHMSELVLNQRNQVLLPVQGEQGALARLYTALEVQVSPQTVMTLKAE